MAEEQEFRFYMDSGQIIALNIVTKERYAIWPKELRLHIQRGACPPFWDHKEVRDLLEQVLPSPQ